MEEMSWKRIINMAKRNRKGFYCPLSPYIMWHHGMYYTECPVVENQRDTPFCQDCSCKGDSKVKAKSHKKSKPTHKKTTIQVEKKAKGPIPKIGKTYVSK
jgi:hypothetical protein